MVKLRSLRPGHRRAAREAREREAMATLQASLNNQPETAGGRLGALIGLGLVALAQRRRKAPWYERWNRRVKRYVPLWTVVAALATIFGGLVALL